MCDVAAQGRLFETKSLGFLLVADHVSTFCLAPTKIYTPSRKAGIHHKSQCCINRRGTATNLTTQVQRERFEKPRYQKPANGQPCKQAPLKTGASACCAMSPQAHLNFYRMTSSSSTPLPEKRDLFPGEIEPGCFKLGMQTSCSTKNEAQDEIQGEQVKVCALSYGVLGPPLLEGWKILVQRMIHQENYPALQVKIFQ